MSRKESRERESFHEDEGERGELLYENHGCRQWKWIAPSIDRCDRAPKGNQKPSTVQHHRLGISVTAVQKPAGCRWEQANIIVDSGQDGKREWVWVGLVFFILLIFFLIILYNFGGDYGFIIISGFPEALCNLTAIINGRADRDHPTGEELSSHSKENDMSIFHTEGGGQNEEGPEARKIKIRISG